MKLSKDELDKLKENEGKLISMKGFLSISRPRLPPVISTTQRTDTITVLLEIECNLRELGDNVIFADITQFNESPSLEGILFDFNATFRLENIRKDEQVWIVKMTAVNDGRTLLKTYIHDTRRQIENLSIPIIFGKLICDMSQWNQSQKYF